MKYVFLTLIGCLFFTLPSYAQTKVDKDLANTYFKNCSKQTDERFSENTQKLFCACTAVKLMENFTVEDMQDSARPDQIGRNATNKMITQIYAPCIRFPAREYHYNTCINSRKTKLLGGNAEKLCNCSADHVSTHLERHAQSMLIEIIKKTPNIVDPMQALYDDREFQDIIQKKVLTCIGK